MASVRALASAGIEFTEDRVEMLASCYHCHQSMNLPDQVAYTGGTFTCPVCRAPSTFAPCVAPPHPAAPYWPMPSVAPPYPAAPPRPRPESRGIRVVVFVVASIVVASAAPPLGVILGLAAVAWAIAVLAQKLPASPISWLLGVGPQDAPRRRFLAAGDLVVGILAIVCAASSIAATHAKALRDERAAQERAAAEARELAERQAHEAELLAQAPAIVEELRSATTQARGLLETHELDAANELLSSALAKAKPLFDVASAPPEVAEAAERASKVRAEIETARGARDRAATAIASEEKADAAAAAKRFVEADELYASALRDLDLDVSLREFVTFDVPARRKAIAAKRDDIANASRKQRAELDAAEAKRSAAVAAERAEQARTFVLGDFRYRIGAVQIVSHVGRGYSRKPASDGARFVVVSYTIENMGDRTETVLSDDFYIVDDRDRKFRASSEANVALVMSSGKDFLLSELQPGISRKMATAFEVPEDVANGRFTLVVPEKGFGFDEVKIALQ